jgi:hypothetical protein
MASVALALALPFKVWLSQRSQIHALQAQTKAQERRVAQLRAQTQRWKDPAYVREQARLRLHYAMPGQTTYVVLSAPHPRHSAAAKKATGPAVHGAWYERLWQSIEAAPVRSGTTK